MVGLYFVVCCHNGQFARWKWSLVARTALHATTSRENQVSGSWNWGDQKFTNSAIESVNHHFSLYCLDLGLECSPANVKHSVQLELLVIALRNFMSFHIFFSACLWFLILSPKNQQVLSKKVNRRILYLSATFQEYVI